MFFATLRHRMRALLSELRYSLAYLFTRAETIWVEVMSGLLAIAWGAGIVWGAEGRFGLWLGLLGIVLLILGNLQIIGALWFRSRMRAFASLLTGPFWSGIAVVIMGSGIRLPSALAYFLLAGVCAWVYLRQARDLVLPSASRLGRKIMRK
jgi:hypothetical protein